MSSGKAQLMHAGASDCQMKALLGVLGLCGMAPNA